MRHRARSRYIGFHIPIEISRPIRAGLLLGVERGELFNLIVDLMRIHSMQYPGKDLPYFVIHCFTKQGPVPSDEIGKYAEIFIEMFACYSVPDLVDNCFWETVIRNSLRVKRPRPVETSDPGVCASVLFII